MKLVSIFGLSETASAIIISVVVTLLATIVVLGILLFILIQKGMVKVNFSKPTRTITGKPKKGFEVKPQEEAPIIHKDLAPLKITVFDIKEERKKYETAQREAIKLKRTTTRTKKSDLKEKTEE